MAASIAMFGRNGNCGTLGASGFRCLLERTGREVPGPAQVTSKTKAFTRASGSDTA